jgi:hypothetical protein
MAKPQKGLLIVTFRNGDELTFEVIIKEQKQIFGRTEYLVSPVRGNGECWKSAANITLL